MKRDRILAVSCAAVLACVTLRAQEATPTPEKPLPVFLPPGEEYLGDFAPYGGTVITRPDPGTVALSNEKAVGFVRWFVKHAPLPKFVVDGWKDCSLRLELQSVKGEVAVSVSAAWRGGLEPVEMGPASKVEVTIKETPTEVLIPMPMPEDIPSPNLSGLFVRIEPGGEYHLKRIEVVRAPKPEEKQ